MSAFCPVTLNWVRLMVETEPIAFTELLRMPNAKLSKALVMADGSAVAAVVVPLVEKRTASVASLMV